MFLYSLFLYKKTCISRDFLSTPTKKFAENLSLIAIFLEGIIFFPDHSFFRLKIYPDLIFPNKVCFIFIDLSGPASVPSKIQSKKWRK